MQITVRNWKNETLRSIALDPVVFDYPLKDHLIWEAVQAYQAAGRAGTHKIKNRSEVSGGTKKLWKQKHTGRARMGDNRSPLWRHGGTVHGPTPRTTPGGFPKALRRNALQLGLAQKLPRRKARVPRRLRAGVAQDQGSGARADGRPGLDRDARCFCPPMSSPTWTWRRATIRG